MLRVILARAGLFIVFASAIWALLPLIAQSALHLGAGGYGLLLGSVGIGAVAGAALLPRLRARLSPDALLRSSDRSRMAAVALVVGGACWVLALSTLNSMYQLSLPGWIKARGMSFYLMVFQGGGAVGSAIMGLIAERAGLSVTLTIAAAGLALGPLAGRVWRFRSIPPETLLPAGDWPAPVLAPDQTPEGPVLVGIQYRARPGLEDQLMTALQQTKDSRRRTGAISWRAWHDASDPGRVLEEFVVASWDDHLRQHERVTKREQAHLERVRELTDPDHPVTVTHWLAVSSRKEPGSPPSRRDCRSELKDPAREAAAGEPAHDKLVELRLFGADGIRQRCAKWSGCQFPRQYRFAGATRASFSFATTAT